jgi:hypothetical protein
MDTIIKITAGIFIVIFAAFTGFMTYTAYTEAAYRNTLTGTYTYTCTISTDSPLYNVTLFIPVPVDPEGNSPVMAAFSSHSVKGVPPGWETVLFDTGKSTLVKVMTPAVIPPQGTSAQHPYTVTLSSETTLHTPIDTRNPVGKSAMFRPVQGLNGNGAYTTSLYADYTTSPDAVVKVTSAVTGKTTWKIFESRSNEYHTGISVVIQGENHGWVVPVGHLESGIGSYDVPAGS